MTRLGILACIVLGVLFVGCAREVGPPTYALQSEPVAPGADAQLQLTEREGNQEVELAVENLAPPERIREKASSYAVWVMPTGRDPVHVGNLEYDEEGRRGELTTVTPHENFELFVTAEPVVTPLEPTGPRVLHWRTPIE